MGATVGDLIQLVDKQEYLGEEMLNVFYFRCTSILGLASDYLEALENWYATDVLPTILAIQNDGVGHVERQWRNLSNGIDLYTDATIYVGAISGSPTTYVPSYTSAGFMLLRESMLTRNGYKRFSGLSETEISGNTFIAPQADIDAITDALASDVIVGVVSVAEPVIVKRPIMSVPVTSYVYSSVGGAKFQGLGTQNTRKP